MGVCSRRSISIYSMFCAIVCSGVGRPGGGSVAVGRDLVDDTFAAALSGRDSREDEVGSWGPGDDAGTCKRTRWPK